MVIRARASKAAAKAKAKEEALRLADKSEKTQNKDAVSGVNEPVKASLLVRAFDSSSKLEPEDIIDFSHWIRQAQGLFVGTMYGALKVTGSIGITSFLMLALVGPSAIIRRIHDFDEEEVAKVGSVSTEGLMPAFALFLLCWIISYTTFL